jgi:hypothetical protein
MSVPSVLPGTQTAASAQDAEGVSPRNGFIQLVEGGRGSIPSPALSLQSRLGRDCRADGAAVRSGIGTRWPLYLALPFWLVVSALMWVAIIVGVRSILGGA